MALSVKNSRGETYFLHGRKVTLRGGQEVQIYYFARKPKGKDEVEAMPAGYEVVENKRTGLPILKKSGKKAKK
ncbi:MAG: hypothetical protein WCT46_06910 [Candidatus Gracilibacteria bacterium]|jgi:hypothetical protein